MADAKRKPKTPIELAAVEHLECYVMPDDERAAEPPHCVCAECRLSHSWSREWPAHGSRPQTAQAEAGRMQTWTGVHLLPGEKKSQGTRDRLAQTLIVLAETWSLATQVTADELADERAIIEQREADQRDAERNVARVNADVAAAFEENQFKFFKLTGEHWSMLPLRKWERRTKVYGPAALEETILQIEYAAASFDEMLEAAGAAAKFAWRPPAPSILKTRLSKRKAG